MKKLLYLFILALVAYSCEDYNEQFDGYDDEAITKEESLTYTLTDDDYSSMGGSVASYSSFSSSTPATDYLPDFLNEKYPTLDSGSSVEITYNFYRGNLEYLDYLTEAVTYELTTADYDSMGEASGQPGKYNNFEASVPAADYLPDFFSNKYPTAEAGMLVYVTYNYYSGGVSAVSEYYSFDGSSWTAVEVDLPNGVTTYTLSSDDYDSMGEASGKPGKYNNFSSSAEPENYLPAFLSLNFPYAQTGDKIAIIYKYYASGSTNNEAIEYTKTEGGWAAYESTIEKTDQYVRVSSGWIYDPTVTYTMVAADYQIIVDYVKNNIGSDYVDSYGTAEAYYGTSAYYVEFRTDNNYIESTKFSSWEEAAMEAIGEVFLPAKFPNATAQVDGVDINYVITFAAYNGSMVDYTIKFQCTQSGPNPVFEYVEGPTVK